MTFPPLPGVGLDDGLSVGCACGCRALRVIGVRITPATTAGVKACRVALALLLCAAVTQRIAVIPGDGNGPEVARIGVRVLESLSLALQFDWFDFGAERYLRDGTSLPAG